MHNMLSKSFRLRYTLVSRLRVPLDWMMKTRFSEYVKVAEASDILGDSQGAVRAWAETGKIPMYKNPARVTGCSCRQILTLSLISPHKLCRIAIALMLIQIHHRNG
jgi:hypothetical protein